MTAKVDTDAEKATIEQTVRASIGWALEDKDKDLLYRSVSNDAEFFIFHPDNKSTIKGFEAFTNHVETILMNDAFQATSFELKDLRINISSGGDAAWYSCFLDDLGTWNGQPAGWVNARWTGVLEKREGNWVIVQMHFSFGTDDKQESDQG